MKFDANLRPFQSVIREMWKESTDAGRKRGLVAVPTGAGKTVTGLSCVADHGRSVFLVNRDELVKQTVAAAQACIADVDVGVVQGNDDEVHARDLIVASIQTLCKPARLERLLDSQVSSGLIRHMIVDEAHHAAAKTWLRVIESFDIPCLGLTATPERADKLGLAKVWGPTPLYRMTIDDAIAGRYPLKDGTMAQAEDGWLVPYEARRVELDGLDMSRVKVNPETGDYDLTDLEKEVYRADVAGSVAKIVAGVVAEGRRPIVFCVSRDQGERTARLLQAMPDMAGKSVLYVDGITPENIRSSAIKDFRSNKIRVLINCQLYTEGMDAPEIDCVVNAAPTQSRIQYIQRIGRGLRLCRETNKTDLLIIDVVGAQEAHGLVTSANMLEDVETPKKGKKRKLAHALELQGQRDREFGMVISTAKASKYGLSDAAAKALMRRHSKRPKWITVLEERVLALPAGEHGALVMIREPGNADSWMGFRLPQDAWDHTNRRRIMARPAPRSFCAGVVEDRARKLGVFGLSDEAARWRDREPTDEQARHWAKMFPGVPILETRGATSDAMTAERLRRLFRSFS